MILTAYYDLHRSPASFDVVAFLLAAEQARIARAEDQVSIQILPGPEGGFRRDKFWPHSVEERRRMLYRVVYPMCCMLPSAAEVVVCEERPAEPAAKSIGFMESLYGLRVQVDAMRAGMRPLRPPRDVSRDPRLVTVTLREAEHWPERNSNVPAWIAAAEAVADRGYKVRIIRDTFRAGDRLTAAESIGEPSALAATDLKYRANLYRSAACNLGVSNGPLWFALALDAPVLMLKPTVENLMRTCSAAYFRECGIEPGGQIPGAPPYQRLVWADDTAEAIVTAFEEYHAEAG